MRTSVAFATALLLALAGCGSKQDSAGAVVRIGYLTALSGPDPGDGQDSESGLRMAIADLNRQRLRIAGKLLHFELAAAEDAQKLCALRVNGVVGPMNPGATTRVSGVYSGCGIPHVTPSAAEPELSTAGYAMSYRIVASDYDAGAAVAAYAADALKLRTLAVIDDGTAPGRAVAAVFKRTALAKGMQVVLEQSSAGSEFLPLLATIKAHNPDAVFYGGADAKAGPMLRQMDQLGMERVRLLGGHGVCSSELARLSGNAKSLAGVVCAVQGATLDRMPGGTAWKQRYDEQFPGRLQASAPYAYDAAFVLVDAMKRARSIEPRIYLPFLRSTDLRGVTARIRFEPNGQLKNPATTLFTYVKGVKTPL